MHHIYVFMQVVSISVSSYSKMRRKCCVDGCSSRYDSKFNKVTAYGFQNVTVYRYISHISYISYIYVYYSWSSKNDI